MRIPSSRATIPVKLTKGIFKEAAEAARHSRVPVRQFIAELVESAIAARRMRLTPPGAPHERPIGYRGPKVRS